jgi:hypothetical protein
MTGFYVLWTVVVAAGALGYERAHRRSRRRPDAALCDVPTA